jgi:hypothetical protein
VKRFVSLQFLNLGHSVGLLGRVQALYRIYLLNVVWLQKPFLIPLTHGVFI